MNQTNKKETHEDSEERNTKTRKDTKQIALSQSKLYQGKFMTNFTLKVL